MLEASGEAFEFPVEWGVDLQSEHERYLTEKAFERPVIVTDYPNDIKAFYMRRNDDGKTVAAMDVLVPGVGEIIGGSQREERLDVLDRPHGDQGHGPRSTTGGTSTCAASAPCPTPASGSASSGSSSSAPACRTSATSSRSREPRATPSSEGTAVLAGAELVRSTKYSVARNQQARG